MPSATWASAGSSATAWRRTRAKAADLYRAGCEGGDRVAACNLGYLYETGVGVAQSWADAVKWYRQAVEESEPRAQYNLAWCYEHGKGVPRDLRQARELYQAAAKQGYAGAQEAADRMEKDGSRRRGGGFLRGFLDGRGASERSYIVAGAGSGFRARLKKHVEKNKKGG